MDRAWRAAGLAALLLGLPSCGGEGTEATAVRLAPVRVEPVRVQTLQERIEATGELRAPEHARIAAEVPGRVTEIRVVEGAAVDAGTVLLEIDRERWELELASVNAQLAEAGAGLAEQEREIQRIRTLHERKVASESRLDQAETAYQLARSRVDAARAAVGVARRALEDSKVTAPFAGFVARRLVSRGEFVNAGTPLYELVALDPIEVEFHLPQSDSSRAALGQPVRLTVDPHPGEIFEAEVTFVSPTIDPRTRTLRVKAQLANPDGRLRPGLFARADLGVAQRTGIRLVPEEAILQRADGSVAFRLVEEDRVERVRVETGVHRDGWVEIKSGLDASDQVVVRGHSNLADGVRVAVTSERHSAITAIAPAPSATALP
ncbi:MAG: efflux RND transporter periplasmic adaptor subunit [Myxococcota bacterium]